MFRFGDGGVYVHYAHTVYACVCVCLGHLLISKVRESFKLILIYLLDYVVVHRCQDGFFTREVLVKVVHIPFGFLQKKKKKR